jgi:hypothetical protein
MTVMSESLNPESSVSKANADVDSLGLTKFTACIQELKTAQSWERCLSQLKKSASVLWAYANGQAFGLQDFQS